MPTTDATTERVAVVPLSALVLLTTMVAILSFGLGWLVQDARPLCALDRTAKQVCVVPQPEGPNRLEVAP